jgi:hypothetical protein
MVLQHHCVKVTIPARDWRRAVMEPDKRRGRGSLIGLATLLSDLAGFEAFQGIEIEVGLSGFTCLFEISEHDLNLDVFSD